MEAMRERWTDDRMDDLVHRVDTGFAQVDARFAQVDTRFAEVHEDIAALRVDNKELRREMAMLDRDLRVEMSKLATREELHAEIKVVRSEMREGFGKIDAMQRTLNALHRTLIGAILAGFIGLLVTHFA
jgi:chromosome segregation ATPase